MSVRAAPLNTAAADLGTAIAEVQPDAAALAEGNSFATSAPENPLTRNVVVSIRASLNDLCLQKAKGTWSPTPEALKSIFQQKKFVSLEGGAEAHGDLKSVVLHNLKCTHVKSSFPIAVGATITGVDDETYSSTGTPFSTICLANAESSQERTLQEDDISLAYEFSRKFPGYTADNLATKGIHEVQARRFVLVSADHPIVSAISENADKLQMGEISMMPEGLVKISQSLYDSILPMVKTQVASQIKVRDLSRATVTAAPAQFSSWNEARSELMIEKKKPLKAQLAGELAAAADDAERTSIRAEFEARERILEHDIDHTPRELSMALCINYNFLSK